MSSSVTIRPPPSTMVIPSRFPAMIRSMSLSSNSAVVGLQMRDPSTRPTRTPPTGPWKGISETVRAADAPIIPRTAGSFSWSAERTVAMTWVSLWNSFGKSGRIGLSMNRETSVSRSLGRPSLLKNPPGILPEE